MELKKMLTEALKNRFIANASVDAIEKEIFEIAEGLTYRKYRSVPLLADGLEFELEGVKARIRFFVSDLTPTKVSIELAYFCTSKLPKAKRERVEKARDTYNQKKYMEWDNYKISLWRELKYDVDIETVLSRNIRLSIR